MYTGMRILLRKSFTKPVSDLRKRSISQLHGDRKLLGIIGGGIAGPVFALQILSHPTLSSLYKPIIFEQCANPYSSSTGEWKQSAGAAIGMSPNGLYPLYQLGLQQAVEEASYDLEGLSIWRTYHAGNDEWRSPIDEVVPSRYKLLSRMENISWAADIQTNMRVMERGRLMSLLNDNFTKLGGDIQWSKKLKRLENLPQGRSKATFEDNDQVDLDMVIGADGGWSMVRKHILKCRYDVDADARWMPHFCNASNIYGISSLKDCELPADQIPSHALDDTHACWLDQGHLSTSSLPNGKIRWDLQLPDPDAPSPSLPPPSTPADRMDGMEDWLSKIIPGMYSRTRTIELLRKHAGVWHPVTGTFGRLLGASERIIHSPLRQRVWEEDEIQWGNIVVIGDAARLLLPSSGQGSSFAVEDATVLADAMINNPLTDLDDQGYQSALKEYAHRRLPRSKRMAKQAAAVGEIGLSRTWYWRLLRDVGSGLASLGSNKGKKDVNSWPFGERVTVSVRQRGE